MCIRIPNYDDVNYILPRDFYYSPVSSIYPYQIYFLSFFFFFSWLSHNQLLISHFDWENFTETQNSWFWKRTLEPKQERLPRTMPWWLLNISKEETPYPLCATYASASSPFRKELLSDVQKNPLFQFVLIASCPGTTKKSLTPSFLHSPFKYL